MVKTLFRRKKDAGEEVPVAEAPAEKKQRRRLPPLPLPKGYLFRLLLLAAATGVVIWVYGGDVYVALTLCGAALGVYALGIAPGAFHPVVRYMLLGPFVAGLLIPLWDVIDAALHQSLDGALLGLIVLAIYGLAVLLLTRLPRQMRDPFKKWLPDSVVPPEQLERWRAGSQWQSPQEQAFTSAYGAGRSYGSGGYGATSAASQTPAKSEKKRGFRFGRGKKEEVQEQSPARTPAFKRTTPAGQASNEQPDQEKKRGFKFGRGKKKDEQEQSTARTPAFKQTTTSGYSSSYGSSHAEEDAADEGKEKKRGFKFGRGKKKDEQEQSTARTPAFKQTTAGSYSSSYGSSQAEEDAADEGKEKKRGFKFGRGKKKDEQEQSTAKTPAFKQTTAGSYSSSYGSSQAEEDAADEGKEKKRGFKFGRGKKKAEQEQSTARTPAFKQTTAGSYSSSYGSSQAEEDAADEAQEKKRGFKFGRGKKKDEQEQSTASTPAFKQTTAGGYSSFSSSQAEEDAADEAQEKKRGFKFGRGKKKDEQEQSAARTPAFKQTTAGGYSSYGSSQAEEDAADEAQEKKRGFKFGRGKKKDEQEQSAAKTPAFKQTTAGSYSSNYGSSQVEEDAADEGKEKKRGFKFGRGKKKDEQEQSATKTPAFKRKTPAGQASNEQPVQEEKRGFKFGRGKKKDEQERPAEQEQAAAFKQTTTGGFKSYGSSRNETASPAGNFVASGSDSSKPRRQRNLDLYRQLQELEEQEAAASNGPVTTSPASNPFYREDETANTPSTSPKPRRQSNLDLYRQLQELEDQESAVQADPAAAPSSTSPFYQETPASDDSSPYMEYPSGFFDKLDAQFHENQEDDD